MQLLSIAMNNEHKKPEIDKATKKRENNKKYYQNNSEEIKKSSKAYYKKYHPRILSAYGKKYRDSKEEREKMCEYSRAFYNINKRKKLNSFKLIYLRNKPARLLKAKIAKDRLSNLFLKCFSICLKLYFIQRDD